MKLFIDESSAILSPFDIEGLFVLRQKKIPLGNQEDDLNQLMNDRNKLTEDYRKACERILKDIKNQNG
ncbi:MAG TPA: hypothetical protein VLF61_02230 [Rhabdochlamydiaceae bacterium]|nr:hypothetical protein [Rhabdochlamydiaceae bacterium]